MNKVKTSLGEINIKLDTDEENIPDTEGREIQSVHVEAHKEKKKD